jgi:hypothetical protein
MLRRRVCTQGMRMPFRPRLAPWPRTRTLQARRAKRWFRERPVRLRAIALQRRTPKPVPPPPRMAAENNRFHPGKGASWLPSSSLGNGRVGHSADNRTITSGPCFGTRSRSHCQPAPPTACWCGEVPRSLKTCDAIHSPVIWHVRHLPRGSQRASSQRPSERCTGGGGATRTPSSSSMWALATEPPGAENPPTLPPAASTRWHGIMSGTGFRAIA